MSLKDRAMDVYLFRGPLRLRESNIYRHRKPRKLDRMIWRACGLSWGAKTFTPPVNNPKGEDIVLRYWNLKVGRNLGNKGNKAHYRWWIHRIFWYAYGRYDV